MSLYRRCQFQWNGLHDPGNQCALIEGHSGDHKTQWQAVEEYRREKEPSLADIRKVVREEFDAALGHLANLLVSSQRQTNADNGDAT